MAKESPGSITEAVRIGALIGHQERRGLPFHVLYTGVSNTAGALRRAASLAGEVSGHITILALLPVPYPLPLTEPPVSVDAVKRTLWRLALEADVDTSIQIYLCRDVGDALRVVLAPHSTVFLGDGRWWFAPERRLARALLRDGHAAFLIDSPARHVHE